MSSSQTEFSLSEQNCAIELLDDFTLLDSMMYDSQRQTSLYQPGPYWASKAKNAVNEIKRHGIKEFRGSKNCIGLSYSDNLFIDINWSSNISFKIFSDVFSDVFSDAQDY